MQLNSGGERIGYFLFAWLYPCWQWKKPFFGIYAVLQCNAHGLFTETTKKPATTRDLPQKELLQHAQKMQKGATSKKHRSTKVRLSDTIT